MHPVSPPVQLLHGSNCERGYVGVWSIPQGGGLFLSYRDKTSASAHIEDALYTDDMALVAESRSEMQHMVKVLDKACERWGM